MALQQPHLTRPATPFSEESETDAMAKMMGFSDFGSKPKKRKIDYQQEARVAMSSQAESGDGDGGRSASGSGGNAMPLGRRRERKSSENFSTRGPQDGMEGEGGVKYEGVLVTPKNANQNTESAEEASALGIPGNTLEGPEGDQGEDLVSDFRSQTGLEGYFHPSFIEDPWEKLH